MDNNKIIKTTEKAPSQDTIRDEEVKELIQTGRVKRRT